MPCPALSVAGIHRVSSTGPALFLQFRLNASSTSAGVTVSLTRAATYYIANASACPPLASVSFRSYGSVALSSGAAVTGPVVCEVVLDSGDDEQCLEVR